MAVRALTLRARLTRLEHEVRVEESWQEREGRELLSRWLAASDANVEHWLDLEEATQAAGSRAEALALASGRAVLDAIAASLYELPDHGEELR